MDKKAKALKLAEQGFHVFPIKEGSKEPAISGWPHRATTDPEQIEKWWSKHYGNRNIGIATEASGLLVVDLDDKSGKTGSQKYAALADSHGHVDTLMVQTPTGGAHLYFTVPQGLTLRSSANLLADGIDTRGAGGFVVAPGSETHQGVYTEIIETEIAECPSWIAKLLQRPSRPKASDLATIQLDSEIDIQAARELLMQAEPAIEGEGGDDRTYKVACHLHDLGISVTKGVQLLSEFWNGRCNPPWSIEDLTEKMNRAYKYAQSEPGCKSLNLPSVQPKIIHSATQISESLPPRDWIVEGRLISGYVTTTVAPGGVGKSMFTMLEALAIATGRNLTGTKPTKTGPVLIYNTEDPQDEIERRILALAKAYKIPLAKLDNLFYASGVESPIRLVVNDGKGVQVTKDRQVLQEVIEAHNIIAMVVDPFVRSHSVNENSNNEIDLVVQQLSALAISTQCAISIVHHTRKLSGSAEESMDISRGASALVSAARVVSTLLPASVQDAMDNGLDEDNIDEYVKLIRVKGNMSPGNGGVLYFRKVNVELQNGDRVGTLELHDPGQSFQELNDPVARLADLLGREYGTGPISRTDVSQTVDKYSLAVRNADLLDTAYGQQYKLIPSNVGFTIMEV